MTERESTDNKTFEKETFNNQKVWSWIFHEENSFNSRIQGFISIHAILITAIALVANKDNQSLLFILSIIILGIFLGIIWLILQVTIGNTILKIEQILEDDNLYKKVFKNERKFKIINSQTQLIAWLLPIIFLLCWLLFLMYVLYNGKL